jgi:hypothetical protein
MHAEQCCCASCASDSLDMPLQAHITMLNITALMLWLDCLARWTAHAHAYMITAEQP